VPARKIPGVPPTRCRRPRVRRWLCAGARNISGGHQRSKRTSACAHMRPQCASPTCPSPRAPPRQGAPASSWIASYEVVRSSACALCTSDTVPPPYVSSTQGFPALKAGGAGRRGKWLAGRAEVGARAQAAGTPASDHCPKRNASVRVCAAEEDVRAANAWRQPRAVRRQCWTRGGVRHEATTAGGPGGRGVTRQAVALFST